MKTKRNRWKTDTTTDDGCGQIATHGPRLLSKGEHLLYTMH